MASTGLTSWNALQTLRSRLCDRLIRFTRSDSPESSVSQKSQNDAAFFETDLRYIFTTVSMLPAVRDDVHDEVERRTRELLSTLNNIVNQDLIEALTALKKLAVKSRDLSEREMDSNDLAALNDQYSQLSSLLSLLETSTAQFNLVTGSESSLFILPEGEPGDSAMACVVDVKELLGRLLYDATKQPTSLAPLHTNDTTAVQLAMGKQHPEHPDSLPRRYASNVVNALFGDLRQRNCGRCHEIKLKVSDDWQTSAQNLPLDMFLSCCLEQMGWHQAQCGSFGAPTTEAWNDGICAAIQRAKMHGRNIYLFVGKDGLFDISDTMPITSPSAGNFTTETLGELLDQKALTPITPGDCLKRRVDKKMGSREKAILALGLARCLLEFFDADTELAAHSWKPESIYFLRSSRGPDSERVLYISLRPLGLSSPESTPVQPVEAVGPGNPILLSFARLLLEIESGEKMGMEIHLDNRANLPTWGEMCDVLERVEREGGGNYLRAVEGCLYLHITLRKLQKEASDTPRDRLLRKAIYEQIVRNLEVQVNPQSTKRKRRDSVSELHIAKKLSIESPARHANGPGPSNRDDFEIAIVCALPLEFNAVSTMVDEFWESDYGRTEGDPNIYTNGRIGKHNVVLLLLPNMGKVSAATASTNLRLSYRRLSLVVVTGICGGVPFPDNGEEVLLGDVVISRHVIQYDLGRQYPDEFEIKDTVEDRFGRAPTNIRHLLTMLQTDRARGKMEDLAAKYLQDIQMTASRKLKSAKYQYPGVSQDRLFHSSYQHQRRLSRSLSLKSLKESVRRHTDPHSMFCNDVGCDFNQIVPRERLEQKGHLEKQGLVIQAQSPSIFVGTIGSADTVMKSAEERDRIATAHGLIAFEMEGAGLWDETPCIIVKAICDYADSHKNKRWQDFAAATAAAATKALLDCYIQRA